MSTLFYPTLRLEIDRLYGEDASTTRALYDPLCGREVGLGEISSVVVHLLDGTRTVDEIITTAVLRTGADKERVEQSLRSLFLLNVIEGTGEPIVSRLRQLRSGSIKGLRSAALRCLPEARFACQGSGDCCQSYAYGPLAEADVLTLLSLESNIVQRFPELGKESFLEERRTEGGEVVYFLRSVDDRCVFLLADCRCGIHAYYGEHKKPGLCRDYPLGYIPTLEGLRIFDRIECAHFSKSERSGPSIISDRERIDRLLPLDFDYERDLEHGVVLLDQETACDYGYFLLIQDALVALVGAGISSMGQTLLSLLRMLEAATKALSTCPLKKGQPEGGLAQILSCEPATFYNPTELELTNRESLTKEGSTKLINLASELLLEIGPRIAVADAAHTPLLTVRVARQFVSVLHLAKTLSEASLHNLPLTEYHGDIQELSHKPLDPEIESLMRLSLRHQLFGAQALIRRQPRPALLKMAFGMLTIATGARSNARNHGRTDLCEEDFNFGHMLALRTLRNQGLSDVFLKYESHCLAILSAISVLLHG